MVGLGVDLVSSLLLIAGCRFTILRDRDPVTGSRYTTKNLNHTSFHLQVLGLVKNGRTSHRKFP